jgi:hypothetical protein
MKNIIKLITILLLSLKINAQQIVPYNNYFTDQNKWSNQGSTVKYYKDISNRLNVFVGDWKYVNGNQTFIITIRKEIKVASRKPNGVEISFYLDELCAHYKLVQDFGLPTQQIIYTSQKRIQSQYPAQWDSILYGDSYQINIYSGTVFDITGPENILYPQGVRCNFKMTVNPNVTPNTATWKVTRKPGMVGNNQPTLITIPLDVILTKM